MDRRGFLSASASALALANSGLALGASDASAESSEPPRFDTNAARDVTVYTTADATDLRLSATGTLAFKPMGQPLETQICVFVDPTKRAQTIVGIGGALTDASAEVFAKLSPAKQRELITLRYDERRSFQQIAESVRSTAAAVQRSVSRIRVQLHDCVHRSRELPQQG